MTELNLVVNDALTMTSLEIADLVESRHDSVRRTIDRLANQGVIVQPPLVDEPSSDAMGRSRVTQVYVFSDADHAYTSTKFTSKGVDWVAGEWARYQLRQEVAA